MIDIQPDRFVRINPDIMEALAKIRIPGEARQVLDFIIRKTWGWQKKEDRIALSQFVLGTNLKKPNVLRALSKLITMNLIIIKKDNTNGHIYRFNKDLQNWKPLSKKITSRKPLSKKIITVIQKDNLPLSKKIPTKETNTKETNIKESIKEKDTLSFCSGKISFSIKEYPHFIDEEFKDIWEAWIEIRKKKRTPNTQFALKLALNKLKAYSVKEAVLMLEESVGRGWTGVFPFKSQVQGVQYGRSKGSVGEDKFKGIGTEIRDV